MLRKSQSYCLDYPPRGQARREGGTPRYFFAASRGEPNWNQTRTTPPSKWRARNVASFQKITLVAAAAQLYLQPAPQLHSTSLTWLATTSIEPSGLVSFTHLGWPKLFLLWYFTLHHYFLIIDAFWNFRLLIAPQIPLASQLSDDLKL